METLLKQLRELPARLAAMPAGLRWALIGGLALAGVVALGVAGINRSGDYQYAFTNLSQEDSTEATGILQNAGVPYRVEANGSALAVPAEKVYDARILLATAGLPRGAGVGFELFDRGDLGVSEFTQRVNLRRAIEGELARTIGKFSGVRSARVTVSLGERGLYRDNDTKASASVVVVLQPGRTLGERELAGIRHLVSSSTPGLPTDSVTVMDGRGAVLTSDSVYDSPEVSFQRKVERDAEQKIIESLERVVGVGAVIAKVTASLDNSVVNLVADVVDPDAVTPSSTQTSSSTGSNSTTAPAGMAGAVANQPLVMAPPSNAPTQQGSTNTTSATTNFAVSKSTTNTAIRIPRLLKLSVAVIVDGVDGKPRSPEEVARLLASAQAAVGYDAARGDQFELSSQPFKPIPEGVEPPVIAATPVWVYAAIAGAVLAVVIAAFVLARRSAKAKEVAQTLVLQPGSTVAALEAKQNAIDGVAVEQKKEEPPLLMDPLQDLKEKARAMVRADPERAVMLVRAWLSADLEKGIENG